MLERSLRCAIPARPSLALPIVGAALGLLVVTPALVSAQGGSPCAPIAASSEEIQFVGGTSLIEPAAALFANGKGVVVFSAFGVEGDGDRFSVMAVFVDENGQPVGNKFLVNTLTAQDQFVPAVAAAPDGRFVVVWESDVSPGDTDGQSIRARLYDANGQPRGSDFQINDHVAGNQTLPRVGMADDGSFVATWQSTTSPGTDNNNSSIQARRFDANGNPKGPQFQVNSRIVSSQTAPAVGVAPDGRFVVVFDSRDSAGSDGPTQTDSIQARRYSAFGEPLGPEQQVNVTIQGNQSHPRVAVDADGSYLVVWESATSAGSDNDGTSIQARGFLASGVAAGNEVQVNQRTFGNELHPEVAPVGGREFLVVWSSDIDGRPYDESAARAMTLEGQFLGFEYTVSVDITESAVAGNRQGASLIASRSILHQVGLVGQRFSHPCATGAGVTACTQGPVTMCLNQDRFRVRLTWRNAEGDIDLGQAVELTPDTGYFWIFDPANVEVVIKVLNACSFNQRYWAFIAGLTDLAIDVRVEDTLHSEVRIYTNPLGSAFLPITDTDAFATCP
jgi:hypothetical protein